MALAVIFTDMPTGNVDGKNNVGGFVGSANKSNISGYATGNVTGHTTTNNNNRKEGASTIGGFRGLC